MSSEERPQTTRAARSKPDPRRMLVDAVRAMEDDAYRRLADVRALSAQSRGWWEGREHYETLSPEMCAARDEIFRRYSENMEALEDEVVGWGLAFDAVIDLILNWKEEEEEGGVIGDA